MLSKKHVSEASRLAHLLCVLSLVAGLACSSPPKEASTKRKPDFLLLSIDTLRADHMGGYGYPRGTTPHIDRLMRRGWTFASAYTASPNTLVSHATILTGLYPEAHGAFQAVPLSPRIDTLAESLSASGYQTGGFTGHGDWLCRRMGFAQGFGSFESAYVTAGVTNRKVFRWLADISPDPFFLFVHYYDVHAKARRRPYETKTIYDDRFPLPNNSFSGCRDSLCAAALLNRVRQEGEAPRRTLFVSRRPRGGGGQPRRIPGPATAHLTPSEILQVVAMYDDGIAFADRHVGLLVKSLGRKKRRAFIMLLADHGEEFNEHGRMLHHHPYEEIAHVPLVLVPPDETRETVSSRLVSLSDVTPTIKALLDVAPPSPRSFATAKGPTRRRPATVFMTGTVFMNGYPIARNITVRTQERSLVARQRVAKPELYDRLRDPGESQDVAPTRRKETRRLSEEARRFHLEQTAIKKRLVAGRDRTTISKEEKERLEALGYRDDP